LKFNKLATSANDLISKVEKRGLVIPDLERTNRYLTHIGYYRLSAYMLPFQINGTDHQFIPHTKFDDVLKLYIFDRKLRLHLLEAIERIEISLRSQMNDIFVLNYGAHGYLERKNFKENYNYDWFISQLRNSMKVLVIFVISF
jgi:abortive infection bacteriophage resistance protein